MVKPLELRIRVMKDGMILADGSVNDIGVYGGPSGKWPNEGN